MPETLKTLHAQITSCTLCADRFATTATAHQPRPVAWLSDKAPILIAGQAPGARVHESGRPFTDASGDRLRDWLGAGEADFYDKTKFAILPMAFCFPGYDAKGSDIPPPKLCAATWRAKALAFMPQIRLTLLVGGYSQQWHLPETKKMSLTARVENWRTYAPDVFPLPHPSWRNTGWLRKNPWFEADLLPELRAHVAVLLKK